MAYSDADWGVDQDDIQSTMGHCFSLDENGPDISWKSMKQSTVVLSTCEAEYMALAATPQENLFLVQLLNGMDNEHQKAPVKIVEDNQGKVDCSVREPRLPPQLYTSILSIS